MKNLLWRRAAPNSYDLILENPESLDRKRAKTLYEVLISTKWAGSRSINKIVRVGLSKWFDNPTQALRSKTYVLLSVWFSSIGAYSDDKLGIVAGQLWDFLFLCRPSEGHRLSSREPGKHQIIIPKEFDHWWSEQQRLQGTNDGG